MAFSYSSILDEALRVATLTGGDANTSSVVDSGVALEDLFFSSIKQAIVEASDPFEAGAVKVDHTITITNGVGAMPDAVIDDLMDGSTVYSDDGLLNGLMSFCTRYFDYIREGHSQLGYYAVQGTSLFLKGPGDDPGEYDGDIHLVTASVPVVVDATTALIISTETAKRTIEILAQLLRGQVKA